jgi:type IV secretory pathway TraG/TraD family ATPase VirD4
MKLTDQHIFNASVLICALIVCLAILRLINMRKGVRKVRDALAPALFWWTDNDPFTERDLLNGGVAIFGRTGSGKTSSSGRVIASSVVRLPGSGGLILSAKPEDKAMWQGIFKAAGREGDLLVFSPDSPLRFNFIDYEMRAGGHTRNIVRCITTIGETLRSTNNKGGENADFWEAEQTRMLQMAVEVVKQAHGRVTAPDLQKFIGGAATSPEMLKSDAWFAGFHAKTMQAAHDRKKSPIEQHDFDLAADYWVTEYPAMADRTRSSISTGVFGILSVFNTGVVRELVSTATNVTPEDMFRGKWILVDMPPSELGDVGLFVAGGWKYLAERAVLRRAEPGNVVTIWCDEAQQFVNSYDAHYLAQCRSHGGCLVMLTQSIHSYYAALHGERGKHQADGLLTNFHTKIFHALGDQQTAEWASGLIGRSLQVFVGGSVQPADSLYDDLMGRNRYSGSFHENYENTLQSNVFMNGLRTGGHANGLLCDAIVVRSGEPFSTGENWQFVTFSQRGET